MAFDSHDTTVLRALAERVAEIAATPDQARLRRRWVEHNALRSRLPMVVCFAEGAWRDCLAGRVVCRDPLARRWETRLRMAIYLSDVLGDDQPVDPWFNVARQIDMGDFGLASHYEYADAGAPPDAPGDDAQAAPASGSAPPPAERYVLHHASDATLPVNEGRGAFRWEPALREEADLDRLRLPVVRHDAAATAAQLAQAQEAFGDLLPVRLKGWNWEGASLGATAVGLRGMEQLMFDVYDRPEWLKRFVAFLARGVAGQLDQLEAQGLLSLNNESEWVGTGGIGNTDELPAPDFAGRVRTRDMWGLFQSQDLVNFSPGMVEEFFWPQIEPLMRRFGLNCYGCCEPVHDLLGMVRRMPALRRLSVSPWADVKRCCEAMGPACVLSVKPNPTAVSTQMMDDAAIARGLRETFEAARANDCVVEVMMKDVHTVCGDAGRLTRWVALARRERDAVYGA